MIAIAHYMDTKNELDIVKERLLIIREYQNVLRDLEDNLNQMMDTLGVKLSCMDKHLKELQGIENALYYEIVVKGNHVTRAVDIVAFKVDKDVSTIWKHYYPKVKKKLEELSSEDPVEDDISYHKEVITCVKEKS